MIHSGIATQIKKPARSTLELQQQDHQSLFYQLKKKGNNMKALDIVVGLWGLVCYLIGLIIGKISK